MDPKAKKLQKFKNEINHGRLTANPTAPRPKTATVDPSSTSAVFHTAPRPNSKSFNCNCTLRYVYIDR